MLQNHHVKYGSDVVWTVVHKITMLSIGSDIVWIAMDCDSVTVAYGSNAVWDRTWGGLLPDSKAGSVKSPSWEDGLPWMAVVECGGMLDTSPTWNDYKINSGFISP
ncbi:hypothetical protein L484_003078 [Morus notabilis]|uniref:Uncharacterized protein n=1 Tax=Morus notabilis TaxID=981085 RepID=W9RUN2_9ROSA|nr:hypothetical protein L484_003078 [Morus notabilis]